MTLLEQMTENRDELKSLERRRQMGQRDFTPQEATRVRELLDENERLDRDQRVMAAIANGPTQERNDPVANPDSKRYSLSRAVERRLTRGSVDGYEGEISQEIARRIGRKSAGDLFVPLGLPCIEGRDLTATTGAGAIGSPLMTGRFIDLLRAKSTIAGLGATLIGDAAGTFSIPRFTAGVEAHWVTEGNAPADSSPTLEAVAFSPATVSAVVPMTRSFVKQAGPAAERMLRSDLAAAIGTELDRVAIAGDSGNNEPVGILNNGAVTTVSIAGPDGGPPTWAKVVELESTITENNADRGRLAYLTSPSGRATLKQTPIITGGDNFLWDRVSGLVNGYPALSTSNVPSDLTKGAGEDLTALIFGDFSTIMLATWGMLDLFIDPVTLSSSGGVRLIGHLDAQIKLRHAESLAKIVDMGAAA